MSGQRVQSVPSLVVFAAAAGGDPTLASKIRLVGLLERREASHAGAYRKDAPVVLGGGASVDIHRIARSDKLVEYIAFIPRQGGFVELLLLDELAIDALGPVYRGIVGSYAMG